MCVAEHLAVEYRTMLFLEFPLFSAFLLFVLGLCFGSFSNVIIARVPRGEGITGRSHCMFCKARLHAHELVPVLSFLVQAGRCRTCKERIAWRYPLIELGGATLFIAAAIMTGTFVEALLLGVALWLLGTISLIDMQMQRIPDALNIPFFLIAALYHILFVVPIDIIAPLIGVLFFGAQWLVSGGRWIGSGDIILIAGIGLLAGSWPLMLITLLCAYGMGALVAAGLLLQGKKKRNDTLAFAPFLAAGLLVALLAGPRFLQVFMYT